MPSELATTPPAARARGAAATSYDFRRTDLFNRDAVRSLQAAHELFMRRVTTGWGSALRALVQLDPIGVDQVPYDAYIRSMPNPNVLSIVDVPPLPGPVVLELNPQLALALVDRLLGGRAAVGGMPVEARRPTDVETALLGGLTGQLAAALGETLAVVPDCETRVQGLEYNPQLVQVANPSDMVVVMSYRLAVSQGVDVEGLLTVCYPAATITVLLDHLQQQRQPGPGQSDQPLRNPVVVERLADVPLRLTVAFEPSAVSAGELARLSVGDVLRLDHRLGAPVHALVGGRRVLSGHLGRRGRRLALQVAGWTTAPAATPGAAPTAPPVAAPSATPAEPDRRTS